MDILSVIIGIVGFIYAISQRREKKQLEKKIIDIQRANLPRGKLMVARREYNQGNWEVAIGYYENYIDSKSGRIDDTLASEIEGMFWDETSKAIGWHPHRNILSLIISILSDKFQKQVDYSPTFKFLLSQICSQRNDFLCFYIVVKAIESNIIINDIFVDKFISLSDDKEIHSLGFHNYSIAFVRAFVVLVKKFIKSIE